MDDLVSCPECGAPMQVRIARRGSRAGQRFYGCSRYPRCRGVRPIDEESTDTQAEGSDSALASRPGVLGLTQRVRWPDRSDAPDWTFLYTIGGGRLRSTPQLELALTSAEKTARARLEQTFLAVRGTGAPTNHPEIAQAVGTFRKILQRGDRPPLDPSAEWALARSCGLDDRIPSGVPGSLDFEILRSPLLDPHLVVSALTASRESSNLRDDWLFDSEEERLFVELVSEQLGAEVSRWLYPQPPFAALLEDPTDLRRADFLFSAPWQESVVVEIDGSQHDFAELVDDDRDEGLDAAGYKVVRIAASALRQGDISAFTQVVGSPPAGAIDARTDRLVYGPAQGTRLGLALAEALERGWLEEAGTWRLAIHDSLGVADRLLPSILELLASVDELWAGFLAPSELVADFGERSTKYTRTGVASYQADREWVAGEPDVAIYLEHDLSPMDALPAHEDRVIVVRGASLPVRLAERRAEGSLLAIARDPEAIDAALERVLQYVFAKKSFREGQMEALAQVLQRRDCLVLLPTGAGKSLIYQLAGLLLPGRTVVIDPIVALMEDQIESLRRAGIDRAVGMSSFVTQQGLTDATLDMVRSGDALFFFVAPERLQQGSFREALETLTVSVPINLAVVDEAHCISEWGHDFRPAYLNLGPTLRKLCRAADGTAPPMLALTGTASRAVLRDVLIELDLDRSDPSGIVKPESFSRPELSFQIVKADAGAEMSRLIGVLNSVPRWLGNSDLMVPRGRNTDLGIIFCPHVNGDYGVTRVAAGIRRQVAPHVGFYSGSAPRGHDSRAWEFEKREVAERFRRGDITILCTTKAFGMGVDIPNVRYTVHYGIPGSIEGFYQEAGRAGRDRRPSRCAVVFSELDSRLSEQLLSDAVDVETARDLFDARGKQSVRGDILRQLWFHFNTFSGKAVEERALADFVETLDWNGEAGIKVVPFGDGDDVLAARERAILRLHQVGAVTDYLKEWGSRSFEIRLAEATLDDLDAAYLSFVARAQPGRLEERRSVVGSLPAELPADRAKRLATMAMELVYDTVEKSRRRALREMRLLAVGSLSNREIQQRIEDYFREGDLAPQLEALVESTELTLSEWFGVLRTQTRMDEGELRGATARLLESYPDHPGLLLGRALVELIGGTNEYEFKDNLTRSLAFGAERYGMSAKDLAGVVEVMLELADVHRPAWRPLVWTAAEDGGELPKSAAVSRADLVESGKTPGESVVLLEWHLREVADLMESRRGVRDGAG